MAQLNIDAINKSGRSITITTGGGKTLVIGGLNNMDETELIEYLKSVAAAEDAKAVPTDKLTTVTLTVGSKITY